MVEKIKASAAKPPSSDREKAIGMMEMNKLQNVHSIYVRETVNLVNKIEDEVKTHSQWLYDAKESLKRKIFQSAGIHVELSPKRIKTVNVIVDAENINPNTVHVNSMKSSKENKGSLSPQETLDITSMKVVELREELRARDLDTKGLKKELQKRLEKALEEEEERKTNSSSSEICRPITNSFEDTETNLKNGQERTYMEGQQEEKQEDKVEKYYDDESGDVTDMDVEMTIPEVESTPIPPPSLPTPDSSSIYPSSNTSHAPDSTTKKIERSIDDLTKLRVDSLTEEKSNQAINHEMVDLTADDEEEKPCEISSASKPGRVQKLMKATSKLFSPSKKRDATPIKQSPFKLQSSASKSAKKRTREVTNSDVKDPFSSNSVSVTEMASRWESGNVQGLNSQTKPPKPQTPSSVVSNTFKENHSAIKMQASVSQTPAKKGDENTFSGDDGNSVQIGPFSSIKKASNLQNSTIISVPSSSESDRSGPSNGSSTTTSQRLQQKKEQIAAARKARLEEMRDKSKALAKAKEISMSATKKAHTMKTQVKSELPPQKTKVQNTEDKMIKMQIKEKMRQKAAAEALKKANAMTSSINSSSATDAYKQHSSNSTRETPQKKASAHPKALSPMDTYEISDREDSDSDYSDEDKTPSPKKRIPRWARSVNLGPALQRQFLDPNRLDPEQIFHDIQTCNLEDIFDQKRARYSKRTSSGNWTNDKVTAMEKLVYKRQMGFTKS